MEYNNGGVGTQEKEIISESEASVPFKKKKAPIPLIIVAITAVVLVIGIVVYAVNSSPQKQYDHQMAIAKRYLEELNYDQAIAAYRSTIEINPKETEAYQGLADVYIAKDDLGMATDVLWEGYEQTGDNGLLERDVECYLELADRLYADGKGEEALEELNEGALRTRDERIQKRLDEETAKEEERRAEESRKAEEVQAALEEQLAEQEKWAIEPKVENGIQYSGYDEIELSEDQKSILDRIITMSASEDTDVSANAPDLLLTEEYKSLIVYARNTVYDRHMYDDTWLEENIYVYGGCPHFIYDNYKISGDYSAAYGDESEYCTIYIIPITDGIGYFLYATDGYKRIGWGECSNGTFNGEIWSSSYNEYGTIFSSAYATNGLIDGNVWIKFWYSNEELNGDFKDGIAQNVYASDENSYDYLVDGDYYNGNASKPYWGIIAFGKPEDHRFYVSPQSFVDYTGVYEGVVKLPY